MHTNQPSFAELAQPVLITADEAAEMLTICRKTLERITRKGLLPVVRVERSVRYRPADILAYIDRQADASMLTKAG